MDVNWLDIAILLVFFWFGFTGLTSGLLRSGLTMLAFLIGVVLAGIFYVRLANDLRVMISDDTAVKLIAMFAIFGATALAGQLLAVALKETASVLFFGPFDGVGGLALGLVKAFILVELVLILFARFHYSITTQALNSSSFAPLFLGHIPVLTHFLPSDFQHAVSQFAQSRA